MTISEEIITNSAVSLNELFPNFTSQFIKPFKRVVDPDIQKGLCIDFELCDRKQKNKINPILRLARPEDAEDLVDIYKELYDGTYPYKEMEDINEVRRMIQDSSIQWIIYQDPSFNIAGCITFVLDFENRRGYIRGFMLKKKYQGYIDITKAMIGSMLGMIYKYKSDIYVWYVENRTAHSKSQYSMWVCGIAPIGFYPNKDIFLGKVESDLMQILYDERVLRQFRSKMVPQLLPEVENCYLFTDKRYKLGEYHIKEPIFSLDQKKIHNLKKRLRITVEKDDFGYEKIRFSFLGTDSYFKFLYTPQVKNFEKTEYNVNNLEELYVFIKRFMKCGQELGIRYCEAFISAYKIEHQKLFSNVGLSPRGYIPSWRFNNKKRVFEDQILYNWFKGKITEDIQLIDEGKELLEILELNNSEHVTSILEESRLLEKLPSFYSIKEKLLNIWNYPKIIKSSLMTGLIVYLSMVVMSIIIANSFGYHIVSNTISQLGSVKNTPTPFIFDYACIIGGPTTILLYCFLSKKITIEEETVLEKLSQYGVIIGIVGSLGIISLGIFSLDRSGPFGSFHILSTLFAFGGYVVALLTYGIMLFKMNSKLQKVIGINGIVPLLVLIGFISYPTPLMEWMLLFTILTSLIPMFCWVSFH